MNNELLRRMENLLRDHSSPTKQNYRDVAIIFHPDKFIVNRSKIEWLLKELDFSKCFDGDETTIEKKALRIFTYFENVKKQLEIHHQVMINIITSQLYCEHEHELIHELNNLPYSDIVYCNTDFDINSNFHKILAKYLTEEEHRSYINRNKYILDEKQLTTAKHHHSSYQLQRLGKNIDIIWWTSKEKEFKLCNDGEEFMNELSNLPISQINVFENFDRDSALYKLILKYCPAKYKALLDFVERERAERERTDRERTDRERTDRERAVPEPEPKPKEPANNKKRKMEEERTTTTTTILPKKKRAKIELKEPPNCDATSFATKYHCTYCKLQPENDLE
eukprot:Pgem_evm1s5872